MQHDAVPAGAAASRGGEEARRPEREVHGAGEQVQREPDHLLLLGAARPVGEPGDDEPGDPDGSRLTPEG